MLESLKIAFKMTLGIIIFVSVTFIMLLVSSLIMKLINTPFIIYFLVDCFVTLFSVVFVSKLLDKYKFFNLD